MALNSVSVALGPLTKSYKRTSKDLLNAFSLTNNNKDDIDNDNNQQTIITTAKNNDDNNANQATLYMNTSTNINSNAYAVNNCVQNVYIDDYFLKLWVNWTASCSNNKQVIPGSPSDILKINEYIINNHGWWPMFGGKSSLKRKNAALSSTSSTSLSLSSSTSTSCSLFNSPFPKRQKIHNNSHYSSQFSDRNYISVEWCPEENQIHTIIPPRTKTSSLSQENYAVITHRILALRLKSRNSNSYKGGSAFRFRRSVIKKVAKVNGLDPDLHLPDIFVDDFEQYIETTLMKNPWKDGTTEPIKGDLKAIKIAHINQ